MTQSVVPQSKVEEVSAVELITKSDESYSWQEWCEELLVEAWQCPNNRAHM